jgi:hypothetical protein
MGSLAHNTSVTRMMFVVGSDVRSDSAHSRPFFGDEDVRGPDMRNSI